MSEPALETGGDEVLADLEAAFDAPEVNENTTEEAPAEEIAETEPTEAEVEPEAEAVDEAAPVEEEPHQPDNEDGERILAPAHWRGDAKIRWNKLPKAVQQEIARDYEQRAETDGKYSGIERVLEPRRDVLAAQYGSVENAVQQLFALSDFATKDPVGFIQHFAQQRGINLPSANPQEQGETSPQVLAALQEIQQLKQQLHQVNGTIESQSNAQLQAQIDAFRNDPTKPYFEDVRVQMGALIQAAHQRGESLSMNDAYEMAVYANPTIRQGLLAEQAAADAARKAEKVAKAKAATSISGAPGAGGSVNDAPASTIEEELARAFEEAG